MTYKTRDSFFKHFNNVEFEGIEVFEETVGWFSTTSTIKGLVIKISLRVFWHKNG